MDAHYARATALVCLFLLALVVPSAVSAQWSFEGRIGSALPSGELTDQPGLSQTAGLSFAADAMFTFNRRASLYAGAARQSFRCDGCAQDVSTVGFDGGLKLLLGSSGAATPWVRGGLMIHRASLDGVNQDWGLGIDSAAGIDWLVTPRLALVPALRLNSYNSGPISLTYFTIDFGLHFHPSR